MASPPRNHQREEERRLNTRTLAVASVASAAAAAVTSQLWIHGTWVAAAVTPVLVALVSEAIHRPTERIVRARTSERPALSESEGLGPRHAPPDEPLPEASGAAAPPPPSDADPLPQRAPSDAGPVRVYRQPTARRPRRRVALGVVAATAAIAFLIAVVAITAADLLAGDSIGKGSGTSTFVGGGGGAKKKQQDATPEKSAPAPRSTTEESPAVTETTPAQPPSDTAPATPPEDTPPGEPAPDPAPSP